MSARISPRARARRAGGGPGCRRATPARIASCCRDRRRVSTGETPGRAVARPRGSPGVASGGSAMGARQAVVGSRAAGRDAHPFDDVADDVAVAGVAHRRVAGIVRESPAMQQGRLAHSPSAARGEVPVGQVVHRQIDDSRYSNRVATARSTASSAGAWAACMNPRLPATAIAVSTLRNQRGDGQRHHEDGHQCHEHDDALGAALRRRERAAEASQGFHRRFRSGMTVS